MPKEEMTEIKLRDGTVVKGVPKGMSELDVLLELRGSHQGAEDMISQLLHSQGLEAVASRAVGDRDRTGKELSSAREILAELEAAAQEAAKQYAERIADLEDKAEKDEEERKKLSAKIEKATADMKAADERAAKELEAEKARSASAIDAERKRSAAALEDERKRSTASQKSEQEAKVAAARAQATVAAQEKEIANLRAAASRVPAERPAPQMPNGWEVTIQRDGMGNAFGLTMKRKDS